MKLLLKKISFLKLIVLLLLTHPSLADTDPWEKRMMADLLEIVNKVASDSTPTNYFFLRGDNPRNAIFRQESIQKIEADLKMLDSAGKRTIIYVGYCWLEYKLPIGKVAGAEVQKKFKDIQKLKIDKIYKYLQEQNHNVDNINLHINLMTYVKILRGNTPKDKQPTHDQELFVDYLYPRSDLSPDCKKAIIGELNQTIKGKGEGAISKDPNRAMVWRAKLLKDKLIACPTIPAITGDQAKDLLAMLNYVKAKAAGKENILLRTAPATPKQLAADNIKLDKITYAKLQFDNFTNTNPSFSIPEDYQIVFNKTSKTKATFQFFNKNQKDTVLMALTLTDKDAESKKDSLEKWLMGNVKKDLFLKDVKWISQYDQSIKTLYNKPEGTSSSVCGCTYIEPYGANTCCNCACRHILSQSGITLTGERIYLAKLSNNDDLQGGLVSIPSDFQTGLDFIDDRLVKNKKPIMFGVHYDNSKKKNPYNKDLQSNNSPSMHFMIIVGKVYRNNKEYLRFCDVGRGDIGNGANPENLFEINRIEKTITANYNGYFYTLTELRK